MTNSPGHAPLAGGGPKVSAAGLAALGGGYFWVVQFLILRIQQRLLTPWDLYYSCARIVLCLCVDLPRNDYRIRRVISNDYKLARPRRRINSDFGCKLNLRL